MMTTRSKMLLVACGLAVATSAVAQYKSIGTDGRVTYSDQPPPPSSRVVTTKKLNDTTPTVTPLPFGLEQAASKYPVTIYTGERCAPCEDARAYLRNRGVPFSEKTVTSDDDIALFKQQSPDGVAPVVVVGSRRAVGFSQATLSALLDTAGYPATNILPGDYQNPLPIPLSPSTKPAAQAVGRNSTPPTAQPATRNPLPPASPPSTPSAPPGFRF
jgi:glutaredoxin